MENSNRDCPFFKMHGNATQNLEVYIMRKCEKCGASIKSDLRLKVNGGGYGVVVHVDAKQKATTIDDVRVAVCPECGYTEMYLEDLSKLKD